MKNICDVCHQENGPIYVHASGIGPMSFGSCMECLQNYAEMESSFHYLYDMVGTKGEGLHDSVRFLRTFKEGKYISFEEWLEWRRDPVRNDELDKIHDEMMNHLGEDI